MSSSKVMYLVVEEMMISRADLFLAVDANYSAENLSSRTMSGLGVCCFFFFFFHVYAIYDLCFTNLLTPTIK